MDGNLDCFVLEVDQLLASPDAGLLLGELVKKARNPFESNFAAGFAYRVQAVSPGVPPTLKAQLYEKAADAFSCAARDATPSLKGLAEARVREHQAFALITHAGIAAESEARAVLYEQASGLLTDALESLPERYKKTRSHWLGWGVLCRAKANGIHADQVDQHGKAAAHGACARLFGESAEHFREAGQEPLALLSIAWQCFSAGWSAYFAGDVGAAEQQFRRALAMFQKSGRLDLLTACIDCLQQVGMTFEPGSLDEHPANRS